MPKGHTVADMADDYAGLIADEFDGKVDLMVGRTIGWEVKPRLLSPLDQAWRPRCPLTPAYAARRASANASTPSITTVGGECSNPSGRAIAALR
jgi:hypothetical protein